MGKLNDAVTETSEVVARIDKTSRIAIVVSILWLIWAGSGFGSNPNLDEFVVAGLIPVGVYWGWRFIKAGRG